MFFFALSVTGAAQPKTQLVIDKSNNQKTMKQIRVVIEKTKDHYDAYAENVVGVYGGATRPRKQSAQLLRPSN